MSDSGLGLNCVIYIQFNPWEALPLVTSMALLSLFSIYVLIPNFQIFKCVKIFSPQGHPNMHTFQECSTNCYAVSVEFLAALVKTHKFSVFGALEPHVVDFYGLNG